MEPDMISSLMHSLANLAPLVQEEDPLRSVAHTHGLPPPTHVRLPRETIHIGPVSRYEILTQAEPQEKLRLLATLLDRPIWPQHTSLLATGDGKFHFAENVPVRNIGWPLFTAFTPSFERLYGVEIGELSFWEAVSSSSSASMKSVDVMARGSRILITDMSFRVISRSGHCLPPGLPIVLTLPQEWLLEDYVPIVAPAAAVITTKHKLPVEEGEEGPPLKRPKAIVNQELDPRLKRKPPPPPPSVASFKEEEDDVPKPKSKPIIIQTKTRTNENDSAAVGLLLADLVRLSNAPKMSSPPIISDDVLPPFCSPPPQENKDVERKKEAEQQSDESKVVVVVKEEEAERKEVVSLEEVICLDDYKPVGKGKGKRRKKMVVMGPRTRTRRYGQDGLLDFMFRKLSFPTHFFPLFS